MEVAAPTSRATQTVRGRLGLLQAFPRLRAVGSGGLTSSRTVAAVGVCLTVLRVATWNGPNKKVTGHAVTKVRPLGNAGRHMLDVFRSE